MTYYAQGFVPLSELNLFHALTEFNRLRQSVVAGGEV